MKLLLTLLSEYEELATIEYNYRMHKDKFPNDFWIGRVPQKTEIERLGIMIRKEMIRFEEDFYKERYK